MCGAGCEALLLNFILLSISHPGIIHVGSYSPQFRGTQVAKGLRVYS